MSSHYGLRSCAVFGLCLIGLLLIGCGQKGDLYLPDRTPSKYVNR
ncbi:MAG: lipoprotein [Proteobacteria bacterium]|nr:lipoprotein [Pseudomonadota bacterium]